MKSLLNKIASYPASPKIIEVLILTGYNKKIGKWDGLFLQVNIIFEEPSAADSRFNSVRLIPQFEHSKEDLVETLNKVNAVAETLNLEVYNPGWKEGHIPTWIQKQKDPPEIDWNVSWESLQWNSDGTRLIKNGVEVVSATTGNFANAQVVQTLLKQLSPPCQVKIEVQELRSHKDYRSGGFTHNGAYPVDGIRVHDIRKYALDANYSGLLNRIRSTAPNWNIRDVLVALCSSFGIEMEAAELFLNVEEIDGETLNLRLAKLVNVNRWINRYNMRCAFEAGHKPSTFLDSNDVQSAMDFVKEFEIRHTIASGKMIASLLCSTVGLEKIDTLFFAEIAFQAKGGFVRDFSKKS